MPNGPSQGLGHGLDVGALLAQHHVRVTKAELPQEFTGQPSMLTRINQVEKLPAFLELLKDRRHLDALSFCADKDMNHGSAQNVNPKILALLFAPGCVQRLYRCTYKSIEPVAFTSFKSHLTDLF